MKLRLLACLLPTLALPLSHAANSVASYRKLTLNDQFFSEGATFGDLNQDGHLDAVSGPYWWAGPDFKTRHEYAPALPWDPLRYSDNFFAFTHDFNADGWTDILILGFPGVDASWYENPGQKGGMWRRKVVYLPVENESPTFGPLLGADQPPVIVCMSAGRIGYVTWDPKDPARAWKFHPITPQGTWQRYTHGLGFGDVNGDGRHDILEKDGWWEQPASLAGDPVWKQHKFSFAPLVPPDAKDPRKTGQGGAQMHVYDVNGDKLSDVITSINAHGFGISWFEQIRGTDGAITFKQHPITSQQETETLGGVQFSQPHALELVDFDGDGVLDLLTGKRWWAHGPKGDAQPNAAPVVYVFLLRRDAGGSARFEPHLIDDTTGIGTQVYAADANRDGKPDIIVGNKRGTAVLLSTPK